MSLEELNVYQLPTYDGVPEGYLPDGAGRLVPLSAVKPQHSMEHELVVRLFGFVCALANQIRRFRAHTTGELGAFDELLREKYGLIKRGHKGKGNVTYRSHCGRMEIKVQVAQHIAFGPEIQVAREIFASCIADWSAGAREELRAIVDDAFQADKEGQVSREAVFRLLRMDFDDPRWREGQAAIKDSIRVVGSKSYLRFFIRPTLDAPWQAVPIDLAAS